MFEFRALGLGIGIQGLGFRESGLGLGGCVVGAVDLRFMSLDSQGLQIRSFENTLPVQSVA